MKKKTINAVLAKKINDWLNSIDDKELVKKIKRDIIVTGGCITSMLLNEDVNDFDVYLKTKESLKAVAEYYCSKFNANNKDKNNRVGRPLHAWVLDGQDVEDWKDGKKKLTEFAYNYEDIPYSLVKGWTYDEANLNNRTFMNVSGMILNTTPDRIKVMVNSDGIAEDSDTIADNAEYNIDDYLEAVADGDQVSDKELNKPQQYKPVFLSSNAITLSDKIQIVVRFYGEPEEVHKNYDFVHVINYWTYNTGTVLNQNALEAILNKELVYVGSKYPICSIIRTRKFIKRGWQINAGQYVKICFQISKLDLSNIYVLEDQLVGVDSLYFLRFIEAIKDKQLKDSTFTLTQDYLTTVIDRVFG
jgi:hypothetical protein